MHLPPSLIHLLSSHSLVVLISQAKVARRGVSPRLYTFLDALQQFTGIVDTFVSANPSVAALVWGGVKTTIVMASNISSYFDKVTALIMQIGKFCPTYQSFAQLHPNCTELQDALCEYYAIVLRICTDIVTTSQRSAASQVLKSIVVPFESQFTDHINQLRQAADLVKLKSTLASRRATAEEQRLAAAERKETERYRFLGGRFRSEIMKRQAEIHEMQLRQSQRQISRLRTSISQNLSTIEPLKALKRISQQRVPQTAEWFQQDPAFIQWRSENARSTLWCTGTMGTGKTMLISSIIEYLHSTRRPSEFIAYHFCLPDHTASIQSRQILGSITRQLLGPWINGAEEHDLNALASSITDADGDEIVNILSARMDDDRVYIILIDGLDDCEAKDINALVRLLASLCRKRPKNFKLLLASRPEYEKQLGRLLEVNHKISLAEPRTFTDITTYVRTTLYDCLENNKLSLTDPTIISRISETLERDAHGMFLWIQLFIGDICDQINDYDILKLLDGSSPSISKLIQSKIDRISNGDSAKETINLLQYCGVVKRPLTTLEYKELLSLNTDQRSFDASQLIHDVVRIVLRTGGLMYIDEEEETIHYVHHSIKEYLFHSLNPQHRDFNETEQDLHLGCLTMTYLNFGNFKKTLVRSNPESRTNIRPVDLVVASISYSSGTASRLAQKLLRNQDHLRKMSGMELERKTREIIGDDDRPSDKLGLQYQFLEYAKTHWLDHLSHITPRPDRQMWGSFCSLIEGKNELIDDPWENRISDPKRPLSFGNIEWAVNSSKSALLNYELCKNPCAEPRRILGAIDPKLLFPLMTIVMQELPDDKDSLSIAFFRAAVHGKIDSVDLFIQNHPKNDLSIVCQERVPLGPGLKWIGRGYIDGTGWTALQLAAEMGHLDVVERLIAAGADVDDGFSETDPNSTLQTAAREGRVSIVLMLISMKRRGLLDVPCLDWESAERTALENGHYDIAYSVHTVEEAEVSHDCHVPTDSQTALTCAARRGRHAIVEKLLAAGADVNGVPFSENHQGRTALHTAAVGGKLDIVDRLIDAGGDVNRLAKDPENGRSSLLQVASTAGYPDIVRRLLTAGADASFDGDKVVETALKDNDWELAQMLLAAGASIDALTFRSGPSILTPLTIRDCESHISHQSHHDIRTPRNSIDIT